MSITHNGRTFGFTHHQHPDFIKDDQIGEPWEHDISPDDGEDVVLRESSVTRMILRTTTFPEVEEHRGSSVKASFSYQRRRSGEDWEDPTEYLDTGRVKLGDCFKLNLGPTQLKEVFVAIAKRYHELGGVNRILEEAGIHTYDPDLEEVVRGREREVLQKIVESGDGIVDDLHSVLPEDVARSLALLRQQQDRENAIEQFERFIGLSSRDNDLWDPEPWSEADWESFFEENDWIFGVGLGSRKLTVIRRQANLGGADVTGRGSSRVDWLMASEARTRFTVIVDIKTPEEPLLESSPNRNRMYAPSRGLSRAVGQLQGYCHTWNTDGAQDRRNHPTSLGAYTYQPKGIVVIGNTEDFGDNDDKRQSFELYRRNLTNPEIITYDELLERAKFLCRREAETVNDGDDVNDVPF